MAKGTSWTVHPEGTDATRIRLALQRGDVRWKQLTSDWLAKYFDRTLYNQRAVNQLIEAHVASGGEIKGQKNVPGQDHDVWFSVELELDGKQRFIKFVIEPEEDDNPGIVIVSAHPPL